MALFSKTTPEKAAAIVAKLEARRKDLNADLALARDLYGEASLGVEEGVTDATKARDKALKDIRNAESELSQIDATLNAARARHAEALRQFEEEQAEKKWAEVRAIGDERIKLAAQIETDVVRITDNFNKLLKLGVQQYDAAPRKESGIHNCPLSPEEITHKLRLFMLKQSPTFRWAAKWPWGTEEIKPFTHQIADGNGWAIAQRDRHFQNNRPLENG